MKLEEALNICQPNQVLGRAAWGKNGRIMRLMSSARTIEEIKESLKLTAESLKAEDWNIYEIRE